MGGIFKRLSFVAVALSFMIAPPSAVMAGSTKRDSAAELYIISPKDGEVFATHSVRVLFGLRKMGVAPAGIDKENTGHHHLIVDSELPPFDEPILSDEHHLHFGGGQTETVIELTPGKHTLQLILGDKDHIPHDPPLYSKQITITVE